MQRQYSYRQGDRAEYLAQYILSALAIAVPVPRQEDVGADFHCSLLRRDGNNLRPTLPFNIQIKSKGKDVLSDGVLFGGVTTEAKKWRKHEIDQLCQTDTPFLIGLVDLEKQTLELFSTATRFFVLADWWGTGYPREVAMIPYEPKGEGHLGVGSQEDLAALENMPNKLWRLPLGQPLVSISIGESEDPARCEQIKALLEPYLRIEQENAVCFRIGLGYFIWPKIIRSGQALTEMACGLVSKTADTAAMQKQLQMTGRIVASIVTAYRLSGMKKEILDWEPVLRQLPIARESEVVGKSIDLAVAFARS